MTINRNGKAKTMPAGLALGALAGLLITLVLAVAAAKLVDIGTAKEEAIGYFAMGILLLSSFTGAMISVSSIKRQKLLVCGLSALIYYGILLSMTALFFGGQYQGMGVTALLVLCGGAVAALTVMRQGRGTGIKKRRRIGNR